VDELDVYNMNRLHVESEALDLRMDSSLHLRMSSSPLLHKTALPAGPPPVRVLLEARPRPVQDHLDFLIIPMTGVETPLGLMMNPVQSHLNSLVKVEAGAQLPPFWTGYPGFPTNVIGKSKGGCWVCGSLEHRKAFCLTWN
jgi:hypothetical protein